MRTRIPPLALVAAALVLGVALPAAAFDPATIAERSYFFQWMPPTLPSNYILSLAVDPLDTGSVTIGTVDGLCQTNGRHFRRFGTGGDLGPIGRDINAILYQKYSLLVATDEGLSVYNVLTEKWRHFGVKEGLPTPYVQCLADYGAEVLVGTWGAGVLVFEPLKGAFRPLPLPGYSGLLITSLLGDPDLKKIVVGAFRGGLAVRTEGGVRVFDAADGKFPSDRVNGLAGNGTHFFAATPGGLAEFDGDAFRVHTAADGMTSNNVTAVATDGYDVWAGTDKGVSTLYDSAATGGRAPGGSSWQARPVTNALSGGKPVRVTCLCLSGPRVFIGTQHAGLLVQGSF